MPRAKPYDTVILTEPIGEFPAGSKGAVVEAYTSPYEAYYVEILDEDGWTRDLLEDVRPGQIEVVWHQPARVQLTSVSIEEGATIAAVSFSDGKQVRVHADELHALAA
mgnify:CR=1 FL=1